jgi:hypothetical protein
MPKQVAQVVTRLQHQEWSTIHETR